MVRYSVSQLPIQIAPKTTIYALQLHPNSQRWITEFPNVGGTKMSWPADYVNKSKFPERVIKVAFTNHSTQKIINLSAPFLVRFHEVKTMLLQTTKHPDGKFPVHVPYAGNDPRVRYGDIIGEGGSQPTLWHPDKELSTHTYNVAIPIVNANSEAELYIVNQSPLYALFEYPDNGTAQSAESSNRKVVEFTRPDVNVMDAVKLMYLPPNTLGR